MIAILIFIFVLAAFLGFELISKVPSQLHTPLMSGSNAISGITILGSIVSAVGMLLAIVATLLKGGLSFTWIAVGFVIGSAIGAVSAYRVKMTAMPEMVAIFNGFGGLASLLVGWDEYHMHRDATTFTIVSIYLA